MIPINTKPTIFYSSKEYVATVTDTDTLADGFYGTVILNKGTSFTVTLGAAANNSERTVKFINIGAGTVTISDGGTVATLEQNETCAVTCNGSDWYSASGHIRLHSMDDSDDHDAASASDYGKNVRANPSTGAIEFDGINTITTATDNIYVGYEASITGSVEVGVGTLTKINGTTTDFSSEISVNDYIYVTDGNNTEVRQVSAVDSGTLLTVSDAFDNAYAGSSTLKVYTVGSDANDGSAADVGNSLATIQAAIDLIPKTVNHLVTVHLIPTNYAEAVTCTYRLGNQSITMKPCSTATGYGLYVITTSLGCSYNQCGFDISDMSFTNNMSFTECYGNNAVEDLILTTAGGKGVVFTNCNGIVTTCTISGQTTASYGGISAFYASNVISNTNSGSTNTYGLYAENGGIIHKISTQPSGDTDDEYADNGGAIFFADIAAGSIMAANAANVLSAITSTSALKVLKNDTGTVSWNGTTGTGDSVMATIPTIDGPVLDSVALVGSPVAGKIEYYGNKTYITNKSLQKAIDRTSDVAIATVTVADTTDEETLWTGVMAANSLVAGNLLKFHADGVVSNGDSANGNDQVTLRIKVGVVTVATLEPELKKIPDGSHWHINANATQRTIGTTGSRAVHIDLEIHGATEEVVAVAEINTEISMNVTITAEWASAEATNTISLYQGFMEYKN